ncbi:MAG: VCBS repeat-containing protein [Pirellulales bacterium]|nr:VCBS repeat-containing protein [Pirellulales bacterium]
MRSGWLAGWFMALLCSVAQAADGNRLAYLDEFCDPYYVGHETAKLTTPQWCGDGEVEAALVLSIDDLGDTQRYEKFLRPVMDRLKKIDGRAPLSIMTQQVDPNDPIIHQWIKEGLSLEAHTVDHPCPCLDGGNFAKAKSTYDRCVDGMALVSQGRSIGFRMPCCDSMNSASPRFFTEIFNKITAGGNFLSLDSSVGQLFTANDSQLPKSLILQDDLQPRFAKYPPPDRKFVNYVHDYPYPYVIARLCWEVPLATPDDWQGFNLNGPCSPATVSDMKAAIDAAVLKQGVWTLTFHPHNWIRNDQVIELIDYAIEKHGRKVKFYNFREIYERLTKNVLGGQPLREASGQDNGVRVLDLNCDGFMDVVIGNEKLRQTRLWSPEEKAWIVSDFPVELVTIGSAGRDAGVRFGLLDKSGGASLLVRNERVSGVWHFDGRSWQPDPEGLIGLDLGGPVATSQLGRDRGVRLVDLDGDGLCELMVASDNQRGVFQWQPARHGWKKLPFTPPPGTMIVDPQGRDAGCRLVDIDEDGHPDIVFSNAKRYSLHLFQSMEDGWAQKRMESKRADGNAIPPIVREDGTNNGVWFKYRHIWVQNEDVGEMALIGGKPLKIPIESYSYAQLLQGDIHSAARDPND